jgi:hypothetical protein
MNRSSTSGTSRGSRARRTISSATTTFRSRTGGADQGSGGAHVGRLISPNEGRQELGWQDAEGADFLYPPAGNTGGSASVLGNMSSEQNDERQDRKSIKSVARMPKVDGGKATEESDLQFKRETYFAFLKDGTVNDLLANMTALDKLTDEVGIPRNEEYKDGPYLPVVSTSGPVVNGDIQKDKSGDIVGGGPGLPPPEQITVTNRETNGKPDAPPAPKPADQGGSDASPPADPAAGKE